MSAPIPPGEPQSNSALIWVLVGCAGLLVLGLCGATGFGVWRYLEASTTAPYPGPAPVPTPMPTPPYPAPPSGPAPGPGPSLPAPPQMGVSPRTVTATVTSVTGSSPVAVGATCGFNVERHTRPDPPGFWCRAQITCGGTLLYGGPSAGFFPCQLFEQPRRDVTGEDDMTTASDTDAAMRIDTRTGTLSIRDDSAGTHGQYTVEARITDVR